MPTASVWMKHCCKPQAERLAVEKTEREVEARQLCSAVDADQDEVESTG
jgi:hypothetical protein